MAKAVALVAFALFILAIATISHAHQSIDVEGRVYCDTCRIQFETKLSKNIEGATVSLICRDPMTQEKKYETTGRTNFTGFYTIHTTGDHSDEICEVSVVSSPEESCKEIMEDGLNKAQVDLALNEGINQKYRYVNPLGFLAKEALPGCKQVFIDMDFMPYLN